jgi:protein-L-isoaspartate(D-aspartate) O-methyltransferase
MVLFSRMHFGHPDPSGLYSLFREAPMIRRVFTLLMLVALTGIVTAGSRESISTGERFARQREGMVSRQIAARGVEDPAVLAAMREVERHLFVPESYREHSYRDGPLPIGEEQTISQPYIVALMTDLLELSPESKVLEVGTGSGYQAAVLAEICARVYSIEIVAALGRRAKTLLRSLDYGNIHLRIGDGYRGWPAEAPFDGIIVTAAPDHVPQPLLDQLAPGGRLVIPVGDAYQELMVFTKRVDPASGETTLEKESIIPVRFVPMTGEAQGESPDQPARE